MKDTLRKLTFVGLLTGLAGVTGSYATAGWHHAFVVVPIDELVVEYTPAQIVNWAILTLGETGHLLHILLSTAIAVTVFGVGGVLGHYVGTTSNRPSIGIVIGLVFTSGLSLWITGALVPAIAAGASVGGALALGSAVYTTETQRSVDDSRRSLLTFSTGVVAYGGLGLLLGTLGGRDLPEPDTEPIEDQDVLQAEIAVNNDESFDLEGSPGRVSTIGEFYTIDIASSPPAIDDEEWTLTIDGAVENDHTIDYEQLRSRPVEHEYLALRCIGEDLNEDLMDTALWTGTPLAPLLEEAAPEGDWVAVHGGDGYVETFPLEFLEDGLLVYGMNGEILPREHGYPVRLLMPGRWGKLNIKWITNIEVTEGPTEGYWEERGWEGNGPIHTVAKLWTVDRLDDGRIELGGHAYAGDRGIDRVEVSLDDGETWEDAELTETLPGEDVTRMWRYRFEPTGDHDVIVRAIDGEGEVQPREEMGSFPAGATGWVQDTIES